MKKTPTQTKIFVTCDIPVVGLETLRDSGFQITQWEQERPMEPHELISRVQGHDVLLSSSPNKLTTEFFAACGHLEMISQFAAGFDNIDLTSANRLKIPIGNAPGAMKNATADVAFGLMINVSRKMFYMHKKIEKDEWGFFRPQANLGQELNGKTLGIFGLGQIGFELARKCNGAYDMDIIYHNRSQNESAEKELGARYVSFDELLAESDVLSVHCALTPETKGKFDISVFSKMKPTSIFLNTSRGGVHHEEDLIRAMQSGEIWGVGLDVTNPEPMHKDNPLLKMDTACVLPHIGSSTVEARDEMSRRAAQNIVEYYKGNPIPYLINPEVFV